VILNTHHGFCANKPEANPKCNCFEPQLSGAFTCWTRNQTAALAQKRPKDVVHCQPAQRHPTSRQVGSQSQWSGVSGEGEFIGSLCIYVGTIVAGDFPQKSLGS